jgi:5-methylcytosine-specific restriction protein A
VSGRTLATQRAKGRCEVCGCYSRNLTRHHRRPRGMGGSADPVSESAANYLIACPNDHLVLIELHRRRATTEGWLVPQWADPRRVAVRMWDGWYYLLEDGGKVRTTGRDREAVPGRPGPASG